MAQHLLAYPSAVVCLHDRKMLGQELIDCDCICSLVARQLLRLNIFLWCKYYSACVHTVVSLLHRRYQKLWCWHAYAGPLSELCCTVCRCTCMSAALWRHRDSKGAASLLCAPACGNLYFGRLHFCLGLFVELMYMHSEFMWQSWR